jgi:hypothetical protein
VFVPSLLALAALALSGCAPKDRELSSTEEKALYFSQAPAEASPPPVDWSKAAWIDRVARLLRGGRALDPADPKLNLAALLPLEKPAIIDALMAEPLFGDAVLDFNLYFLGGKPAELAPDDHKSYNPAVFDYPQAIAAAQQALRGGDYFKLFDFAQPFYMPALGMAYPQDPADQNLPQPDLRKKIFAKIQATLDGMIQLAQANPPPALKDFCAKANAMSSTLFSIYNAGVSYQIVAKTFFSSEWFNKLTTMCLSPEQYTLQAMVDGLKEARQKDELFFARLAAFEPASYVLHAVTDIQAMDTSGLVDPASFNQFGTAQAQALPNSSTNYDRKRAAYVLKRFFCDDLTPIGVENPVAHTQGQHGSDPSCFSCHYKLDPMAGFLKDYGAGFADYSKARKIVFDDGATADLATYQSAWKAPAGSGRDWNIGYIRSVNHPELNDYGTSLGDLFAIIRKAPEARSCVVRRMFEYFAGEDRMLDAGYLDYLTGVFNSRASSSTSSAAFKEVLKQILLSNSFAQTDPVPGQCYDYAPGTDPRQSPPCAVAYILQKNCVKCHGSVDSGEGGLDLAHWTMQADGRLGFGYVDDSGKQHTRKETFDALLDRLTTADTAKRMPKGSVMSSSDREQLYLWIRNQADAAGRDTR